MTSGGLNLVMRKIRRRSWSGCSVMCSDQLFEVFPADDLAQYGPGAKQNLATPNVTEKSSGAHADDEPTNSGRSGFRRNPKAEGCAGQQEEPRQPASAKEARKCERACPKPLVLFQESQLDFGELHRGDGLEWFN